MQKRQFVLSGILAVALAIVGTSVTQAEKKSETDQHPIFGQTMKSLTGKKVSLDKYKGKVLLIVNVASACGATPQYEPLQTLHKTYSEKGLAVLGFPCNQFGAQEPGSEKEIATFCKQNYGVDFDMFSKVEVRDDKAAPLFKYLTSKDSGLTGKDVGPIGWNFEKFLVGRDGKVLARFRTGVQPDSEEVVAAIKAALDRK
jgi:glutathione peroxidase